MIFRQHNIYCYSNVNYRRRPILLIEQNVLCSTRVSVVRYWMQTARTMWTCFQNVNSWWIHSKNISTQSVLSNYDRKQMILRFPQIVYHNIHRWYNKQVSLISCLTSEIDQMWRSFLRWVQLGAGEGFMWIFSEGVNVIEHNLSYSFLLRLLSPHTGEYPPFKCQI